MINPYQNIRSLVHMCCKLAASLRHIVAASLPQMHFSYANYFSGALFAAKFRHTVVAHCCGTHSVRELLHTYTSCTQCVPQVYSTQLSRSVLAHNVRHKFTAHSCCTLFWHTMCATSLQHTVAVHCSGTQYAQPPSPPHLPPEFLYSVTPLPSLTTMFFLTSTSPPPLGVINPGRGGCTKNKNLGVGWEKM